MNLLTYLDSTLYAVHSGGIVADLAACILSYLFALFLIKAIRSAKKSWPYLEV